jgi:hypothetical protein
MIEVGQIVKNLVPSEPVKITNIRSLGSSFSLTYIWNKY